VGEGGRGEGGGGETDQRQHTTSIKSCRLTATSTQLLFSSRIPNFLLRWNSLIKVENNIQCIEKTSVNSSSGKKKQPISAGRKIFMTASTGLLCSFLSVDIQRSLLQARFSGIISRVQVFYQRIVRSVFFITERKVLRYNMEQFETLL
jgi:hypothetical protein